MSNQPKIYSFKTLSNLVTRLRDDLNNTDFVLLYAYNGTGKTRISMAFKDKGKQLGNSDTLYFNAFTEDLFYWDNDLDNDRDRTLKINSKSNFFNGFRELALEEKIFGYLERYAEFDFKIDYEIWQVVFSKEIKTRNINQIKKNQNILFKTILKSLEEKRISSFGVFFS
jgi:hypothetical protein